MKFLIDVVNQMEEGPDPPGLPGGRNGNGGNEAGNIDWQIKTDIPGELAKEGKSE